MNLSISFGKYSTPNLSIYVTLLPFAQTVTQWVEFLLICTHQNLIRYAPSFILAKLFLE